MIIFRDNMNAYINFHLKVYENQITDNRLLFNLQIQ
jgi:hypothetical protein